MKYTTLLLSHTFRSLLMFLSIQATLMRLAFSVFLKPAAYLDLRKRLSFIRHQHLSFSERSRKCLSAFENRAEVPEGYVPDDMQEPA